MEMAVQQFGVCGKSRPFVNCRASTCGPQCLVLLLARCSSLVWALLLDCGASCTASRRRSPCPALVGAVFACCFSPPTVYR